MQGATKISTPDHTDPDYTDVCYEITREMCDFCCLVDFEFCTRDIGICEPITDRNLGLIVDCALVFGGILCGFPIIIRCCGCFISYRCCANYFPRTAGVSCYELLARMTCYLCCIKFSQTYKQNEDEIAIDDEDGTQSKSLLYKIFYYLFCCFLCPCFFKKKESAVPAGGEPGEEGEENKEYEAVDGAEGEEEEPKDG